MDQMKISKPITLVCIKDVILNDVCDFRTGTHYEAFFEEKVITLTANDGSLFYMNEAQVNKHFKLLSFADKIFVRRLGWDIH